MLIGHPLKRGETPFGPRLIARHVAHRTASLWGPLRFPWVLNPLTRGTIKRLLISASWVANVTFKLPQTPRSHPLFHPFSLHLRTVHHLQAFLCNFCSFLRAFLPLPLRHQRYDFCISTTLLLRRIASLYIELPGTVYAYAVFFRSSVLLCSLLLLSGFSRVGGISWGSLPFLSWHHLLKTFFLSSFSSYLFTP